MSYLCQKCGREVSEDALFCSKCGEKVTALRCANCGKRLPEDSAFCTYCGAKVAVEQEVSQLQQTVFQGSEVMPDAANPAAVQQEQDHVQPQQLTATELNIYHKELRPIEASPHPLIEKDSDVQPSYSNADSEQDAAPAPGNEAYQGTDIKEYHLTRRKYTGYVPSTEKTDVVISKEELSITDHNVNFLGGSKPEEKQSIEIANLRAMTVGREVSILWLCLSLFITISDLILILGENSGFKITFILLAIVSWLMVWRQKITFYCKDGKKIAIRGREKVVMQEIQQDLLSRIEAESEYTGNLSDIVVKKTQYYLPEFEKAKRNEKCRFNWAAFFFNGIFAYYRKSQEVFWRYYKWPFIIYAVLVLGISGSAFLATKSEVGLGFWVIAALVLDVAINIYLLITNIRFAKNFNREYYQHCMVRAESSEVTPHTAGTSVKNAILYWLVISLCTVLITGIAGGLASTAFLIGLPDDLWGSNSSYSDPSETPDDDIEDTYLLKEQCYEAVTSAILSDPSYLSTLWFHDYEDGSPLSDVRLTERTTEPNKQSALVTAAADYTYEGWPGTTFRWYFLATVDIDDSQQGEPTLTVVHYYPLEDGGYVLDSSGYEIPADEWLEKNNDRSTWDYDDYVSYYGFDPADYGYIWYNEIRSGPLDEFFEWAIEGISTQTNGSRLYEITDPREANLTPDDFIGTWQTENGILFTIKNMDGQYAIDLSENEGLGILGGWFSQNLYNIEGDFSGMAGDYGVTSFSVFYDYGSEYPLNTWLSLSLTTSDGTEIWDVVPLISN